MPSFPQSMVVCRRWCRKSGLSCLATKDALLSSSRVLFTPDLYLVACLLDVVSSDSAVWCEFGEEVAASALES